MAFRTFLVIAAAALITTAFRAEDRPVNPLNKVSDKEFWRMVAGFSESGGSFVSDNIVSNEIQFQRAIPAIQKSSRNGVYIGVGPEQNLTYITALKPAIAFILDIRRGNLLLHLTYKALIEVSADRAGFMSRLFARKRPSGLGTQTSARELFDKFAEEGVAEDIARATTNDVLARLERIHHFPLTDDDRDGVVAVYQALYRGGPRVKGDFGGGPWIPSYAELMATTDLSGRNHSFLESEGNFRIVKDYETRNLIVPVVADFAGDHAFAQVGRYARAHNLIVRTLYTSNVEEYLFKAGTWRVFVSNVASLPIDEQSTIVRTFFTHTSAGLRTLLDPIPAYLAAIRQRQVQTYSDVVERSTVPSAGFGDR